MPGKTDEFAELSFPEAPNIVVKPPGPKAKALLEKQKEVDSRAVYYATVIPTLGRLGRARRSKMWMEIHTWTSWQGSRF